MYTKNRKSDKHDKYIQQKNTVRRRFDYNEIVYNEIHNSESLLITRKRFSILKSSIENISNLVFEFRFFLPRLFKVDRTDLRTVFFLNSKFRYLDFTCHKNNDDPKKWENVFFVS